MSASMDSLKKWSNTTLITFKYLGEIENVNKTENDTGATGLMFAAMTGNVELIKILIGFGAELDAKGVVHQIMSPISNSEFTNFLNKYLLWFLFQLSNWEKSVFSTNKKFIYFSTAQTEKNLWKKLVKQIGEIICWIR